MSIRISLDKQPEFYTNLDVISGRLILGLNRAEQVGSIVVKLEGECITALQVPSPYDPSMPTINPRRAPLPAPPGSIISENHKVLYKVQQVFPDDYHASSSNPYGAHPLHPGEHSFPFSFKVPVNNACGNPLAMSQIGGIAGPGGFGSGPGLFGMGGFRVMDGTKQLFLAHTTRILPPSITGLPMEAEVRYYIKVTIQRPGFLKENWRYQIGFKFLPIEPPRPPVTGQEAFARRPYAFRPGPPDRAERKSSFFGRKGDKSDGASSETGLPTPPSIEMSARLPHPAILTCNQPVPLRLVAKKLAPSSEPVYMTSFEMKLIGFTEIRCHGLVNRKPNAWIVASHNHHIAIPVTSPAQDEVGSEIALPDDIWKNSPLPNTVAPSFESCNLSRRYELEIRLGLTWGKPSSAEFGKSPKLQQTIVLPLHFARVQIFSGIKPPPELVEAARNTAPGQATLEGPPRLPPRAPSQAQSSAAAGPSRPQPPSVPPRDPLYPPQLAPGQSPEAAAAPPYDEAPPSYDEAIAENLSGPFDGAQPRPAYSGVTNENAPSQMPPDKH
ncbi:arrestin [Stachybotrys elegans]|uniref:Arrestin n=1 Tax=Stachybotrys elegans TaxID=80388 RepID=A0A8K0WWB8_9HYPO|nr:arrestin [Stachybotrys elegans]